MRAYKTVNDSFVEPIPFTVPRRAEVFQSDIYPPATGLKPALSASEWLSGKEGIAAKIDLESIYNGNTPVEVASTYKPQISTTTPTSTSAPVKVTTPSQNEPKPVIQRSSAPSISEQARSVTAIASQYQDDANAMSDEDTSSFEEITKPVQKSSSFAVKQESDALQSKIKPLARTTSNKPEPKSEKMTQAKTPPASSLVTSSISLEESSINDIFLKKSLDQIKSLLETQTETINSQNLQISRLAHEVDTLKSKVSNGTQEQSDRIRELELELETARAENS